MSLVTRILSSFIFLTQFSQARIMWKNIDKRHHFDVIQLLHEKCLDSVTEYIFSFLTITCLKTAETVSKLWYSIVKKRKMWNKRYEKINLKYSALNLLLQRRISEGFNVVDDEFLHKRLLFAFEKVQINWATGKISKKIVNVGHCSRFFMDSKRIIVVQSTLSVKMWNRWNLDFEAEHLPVQSDNTISELTHLELSHDLLFCSYRDGRIIAWDITNKCIIFQFTDENMSGCDLKIHVAHGLLISYKTVVGHDWGCNQTMFSVRSLKIPFEIVSQELTNQIPCARVKDVKSDDNYFVVFIFCSNNYIVSPDDLKVQLRSVTSFEILREISGIFSSNKIFSYFNGWLVAGLTNVDMWDIEKGQHVALPQTNLFNKSDEYENQVVDIQLGRDHLIIRDSTGTFTVWRFFNNKQYFIQTEEINPLSNTSIVLSGERIKRGYQKFEFDQLQIVSVHQEENKLNGKNDLLTIQNFF